MIVEGTGYLQWQIHLEKLQTYLKEIDSAEIDKVMSALWYAFSFNRRIFLIGNGGSAANASHFAQDLCKATYSKYDGLKIDKKNKTFKAISLCDNIAFITAIANDDGYEYIFANQLKVHAPVEGDILIAISGSGNSPNILKAVDMVNKDNVTTIGVTGFDGGELIKKTKFNIQVKVFDMYIVESIHSIIFHYIIERLMVARGNYNV